MYRVSKNIGGIYMLEFLKKEANRTKTENGAETYISSENFCVDLFGSIGALRNASEDDIITRFTKAYIEAPDTAMKILFYARDVRGGLGERRVFNVIINYLAENYKNSVIKNIDYIAEYGRFDDLLSLLKTKCQSEMIKYISKQLKEDINSMKAQKENISLLAKWLPSVNASNKLTILRGKAIAKLLGMSQENYRKTLASLRKYIKIIENPMREKDYTFEYEKQPSKALFKYRCAFIRNDNERYLQFIDKVKKGTVKLKTNSLYPYDIIRSCRIPIDKTEKELLDVTWNGLSDYGDNRNAIAVIDGSGSMYSSGNPLPIDVAMSLGIYFAERNKGTFHNHFITFSTSPRLIEIKGENIVDKVKYCASFDEVSNTNLQKVFELILNTAVKNKLPQSELPSTIYIISDMEFDNCTSDPNQTIFENAKQEYKRHDYLLPNIVFWNVQSRQQQVPVTQNELGVALVSGASPKIFDMIMSNNLDPYSYMMETLNQERYKIIVA